MNRKSRALKAFVWLLAAAAACMYFSRTVQTITTPKVKLVQATTGRIEQKTSLQASAYFPVRTEVTLNKAKEYPITIEKAYVKPGMYVKKGDVLFTATLNDYQTREDELLKSYNEKAQALIDLDIANRKSSKQSKQNDLYEHMIAKQDALSAAQNKARLSAAAEGVKLGSDMSAWEARAKKDGASADTMRLIRAAETAKATFDAARTDFFNSYEDKKIKVSDEVFKYIKERNQIMRDMEEINDKLVALLDAKQSLSAVEASSEGYIVALNVKEGEAYNGQNSAYIIAKKEDAPILRADISNMRKDVSEGARVEVASEYNTVKTSVTAVVDDTDGRRYAEIELNEDVLRAAGGMTKLLGESGLEVKVVFRARKPATIIPASALHSEGDGEYVFVTEQTYGGFLNSGKMLAKKTPVTVIDRSDVAVSVQEELSYQNIIDRADRAVEDGKPVMEYVE